MAEAVRCLGHPHVLTGPVVSGRHLGRTIGIPTANLALPPQLLCPRHGVYAALACFDGRRLPAVVNIGSRPTVGGTHVTVEPWILDFDGTCTAGRCGWSSTRSSARSGSLTASTSCAPPLCTTPNRRGSFSAIDKPRPPAGVTGGRSFYGT